MNLYKKYISTFSIQDTFVDISGSLVSERGYAYYDQEDPSWGSIMYGSNTIAKSACGPTAMAIVLSTLKDKPVKPTELCTYSLNQGYRITGQGYI